MPTTKPRNVSHGLVPSQPSSEVATTKAHHDRQNKRQPHRAELADEPNVLAGGGQCLKSQSALVSVSPPYFHICRPGTLGLGTLEPWNIRTLYWREKTRLGPKAAYDLRSSGTPGGVCGPCHPDRRRQPRRLGRHRPATPPSRASGSRTSRSSRPRRSLPSARLDPTPSPFMRTGPGARCSASRRPLRRCRWH